VQGAAAAHRALLETLLGTPLIYQPARSADGRALAFAAREGRERAIYFARLGDAERRLIRYGGDDGQELTQIALSRDGALLAYVRGGEPNSKGEIPNPRSLAINYRFAGRYKTTTSWRANCLPTGWRNPCSNLVCDT
jgi:hypothetical protein